MHAFLVLTVMVVVIIPVSSLLCSLGLLVGSWPLSTIIITLLFGAVLCTGLAYFRQDTTYDTWIPTTASALIHRDWVRRYFPEDYRSELAIVSIKAESGSFAQAEYLARVSCFALHACILCTTWDSQAMPFSLN